MINIPKTTEPASVYLKNMQVLERYYPDLAGELARVDTDKCPVCQRTTSGDLTCKAAGQAGQDVYLHSRHDPIREAQKWVDGIGRESARQQSDDQGTSPDERDTLTMCYVVDGFGLGYHVRALYEQLKGKAFIVVGERDIALLRAAFNHLDYTEMLASGRIIFISHANRDEIFQKLGGRGSIMMLGVLFTHSRQQIDSEFHAAVHKLISEYTCYMRTHFISLLANSVTTCKNILYNLPSYIGGSGIGKLKGRFTGCPAVVVSAGPSLQRNIDTLRQIRDKVVVIAVQTTLKPLLASGVSPDFVTSLDYHEISKRFFEDIADEQLANVHLVAEPKATWHVIDTYRGRGPISLLGNNIARLLLKDIKDSHDDLPAGATVAHLAFYLGRYIGADPIIFIGQDLAFTNNVYYSPGNALHEIWQGELNRFCTIEMKEWERIVRNRNLLRKVDDIYGAKIYTDDQMFTYLQQFEKDFARSNCRIIDATEGGSLKQFCQVMTLAQAAENYCKDVIDRGGSDCHKNIDGLDSRQLETGREQLSRRVEEVTQMQEISQEILALLEEMSGLVDDQPAFNEKMVRLNELRAMMNNRDEAYQLVKFVCQPAELFRFRSDRALELDAVEGKDRQRRQLQRDIDYVREFCDGCLRMLGLLAEGLARFDEELAQ